MKKESIRLADHINEVFELQMNHHTEKSGFVKLFEQSLTEDEIQTALLLGAEAESCQQVSKRTQVPEDYLKENLKSLAQKGIIYEEISTEGKERYHLLPFVHGIFESVGAMLENKEQAECLEDYVEEMNAFKKEYTEQVIPVNQKVKLEISSMNLAELRPYLNHAKQFAKMDCICRKIQKERGKACGHPIKDMCMIFGEYAEYYIRIGAAERAEKEEIEQLLLYAEEAGLYHEVYPIEKSNSLFVCNCCRCGCLFMGLANRIRHVVCTTTEVVIDSIKCNQCGRCIEICPEEVFQWNKETIESISKRCIQCRGCIVVCEQGAIKIE